jgi:hypothetical protein
MTRDRGTGDIHSLAGAYALDALTEIEQAAFARHAADCAVCALEVSELQETAARIAEANWSVPPPRMRRAVLAEVSRTGQVTGRRRADSRVGPAPEALTARLRRRAALAVAAAVLATGGGVVAWTVARQQASDEHARLVAEQNLSGRIGDVLAASDAHLARAGQVSIVMSQSLDAAVVVLADLPDPGRTKAYQLWTIRGKAATSVGLLPAGQHSGTVLVANVTGADTFGVSLEPAGGSARPTAVVQAVKLT